MQKAINLMLILTAKAPKIMEYTVESDNDRYIKLILKWFHSNITLLYLIFQK